MMSPRTYARRFRETTGTTPLQWLCAERVRRAQDLLENTDDTIERIATLCGFGSAHQMAHALQADQSRDAAGIPAHLLSCLRNRCPARRRDLGRSISGETRAQVPGRPKRLPGTGGRTVVSVIAVQRAARGTRIGQVCRGLCFPSAIFGETDGHHGQPSLRSGTFP